MIAPLDVPVWLPDREGAPVSGAEAPAWVWVRAVWGRWG